MSRFPIDILFQSDEFAIPATLTTKAGVAKDITVVFDESFSISQIGDTGFVNSNPIALCAARDVPGISKEAILTLHDYIDDENGDRVTGPDDDPIIGTNIAKFNVTEVHKDADGFIELQLSLN
jgi:hypothetical protein